MIQALYQVVVEEDRLLVNIEAEHLQSQTDFAVYRQTKHRPESAERAITDCHYMSKVNSMLSSRAQSQGTNVHPLQGVSS